MVILNENWGPQFGQPSTDRMCEISWTVYFGFSKVVINPGETAWTIVMKGLIVQAVSTEFTHISYGGLSLPWSFLMGIWDTTWTAQHR